MVSGLRELKTVARPNGQEKQRVEAITIPALNLEVAVFELRFTVPYMQNRWSKKAQDDMEATQRAGSTAKKGKKRKARDFEADFHAATYRLPNGDYGVPAMGGLDSLVTACKATGFHMTKARMFLEVLPDGFDAVDGTTPLVSLGKQAPEMDIRHVRNATGVADLRSRPIWPPGTRVTLRVQYDADQFTRTDVANLVMRAGKQVGWGEGRPSSPNSSGLGYGKFEIVNPEENGR